MDKKKRITEEDLLNVSASTGFKEPLITKDYYITEILYLLKDVEGIYFKGGTALHKIFLDHKRLSEDVDYTITRDIKSLRKEIEQIVMSCGLFDKISQDKNVEGFLRLIAHYKEPHEGTVFIDLNQRAKLLRKPEKHNIKHFYSEFIPSFAVNTLSKEELIAEKMAATIGRNKHRDHFDVYMILKAGMEPNLKLVQQKCRQSGNEFNIMKIFNNAKKLKNRWEKDMVPLLRDEIPFQEVMKTLAKHFKLKEEKKK